MLGSGSFVAALLVALQAAAAVETAPPLFHTIPRIHRDRPPEEVFGTQGWVLTTGGEEDKSVVVLARKTEPASSDRLTLRAKQVAGLEVGEHYRFLIRNAAAGGFELVEFQPVPASDPELLPVDDPAVLPRVQSVVQDRLGKDFVLDHLPAEPTLEKAFGHLTSDAARGIVHGALAGVPAVYGLEVEAREEQGPLRVFVFSTRRDFRGEIVYAVSAAGERWSVFVTRK